MSAALAAAWPEAEDAWPAEDWSRLLAGFAAGLDGRFVRSGELLVAAIETIYAMFEGLDRLAEVLTPEITRASVTDLRQSAGRLAALPDRLEARAGEFATAAGVIARLSSHAQDIRRILQVLDIYGMNIKIAGALGDFRIFVDDMVGKLAHGAVQVDGFGKRLGTLAACIGAVRQADGGVRHAHRQIAAQVPPELERCADEMHAHLAGVSAMIADMTDIAHRVEDRIGAVLSAIQVADSTRQRIEHVVAIVARMEQARDDGAVPPAAVAHVAALVAAQIAGAARTFDEQSRALRGALGQLATAGQDLTRLIARLGAAGGAPSLRELEAGIAAIGPMTARLDGLAKSSERMRGEIATALGELLDYVDGIDQIVRDVREIAINTRLLCRQQGTEGRAVAVIAVEVAAQALRLKEESEAVAGTIAELEACDKALGSLSDDVDDLAMADRLDAVMGTLRLACEQAENAIARGNDAGRRLIGQLEQSAGHIGEGIAQDPLIARAVAAFEAVPAVAIDAEAEFWLRGALPEFAKLYTMAVEREIHARFALAGDAADTPAVAAVAAGAVVDVDEDGLF
ncbi:MAG: hypothetical protein KGM17_15430 [Sphingomonadales bacterium]|nr:hypothetical protein [Sphingomonadales bacterium]